MLTFVALFVFYKLQYCTLCTFWLQKQLRLYTLLIENSVYSTLYFRFPLETLFATWTWMVKKKIINFIFFLSMFRIFTHLVVQIMSQDNSDSTFLSDSGILYSLNVDQDLSEDDAGDSLDSDIDEINNIYDKMDID